jgi:hypothetical protein
LDRALRESLARGAEPSGIDLKLSDSEVGALKGRLRVAFQSALETGDLAGALTQVMDSGLNAGVDAIKERVWNSLQTAAESGTLEKAVNALSEESKAEASSTTEVRVSELKSRLRDTLEAACNQDKLASALTEASQQVTKAAVEDQAKGACSTASHAKADVEFVSRSSFEELKTGLATLGQDNNSLRVQLKQIGEEMAALKKENVDLAVKIQKHTHHGGKAA